MIFCSSYCQNQCKQICRTWKSYLCYFVSRGLSLDLDAFVIAQIHHFIHVNFNSIDHCTTFCILKCFLSLCLVNKSERNIKIDIRCYLTAFTKASAFIFEFCFLLHLCGLLRSTLQNIRKKYILFLVYEYIKED